MSFSNIGAVIRRVPPADSDIRRFVAAFSMPAADNTETWQVRDSTGWAVTIVESALRTTPEDRVRAAADARVQRCVIGADVRLDNRTDLARELSADQHAVSDAELLVAAYERWGTGFLDRLSGDFAIVLWDPAQKRLLAARDVLGVRGLAYSLPDDGLVLASTAAGVARGLSRPPDINRHYLREFVSGTPKSVPGPTPYAGVLRLPPGAFLLWHNGRVQIQQYGTLRPASVTPRTEGEAQEEFRHLLSRSVRDQLRARGPVGVVVSGGFDSSAVLCTANDIHAGAGDIQTALRAYSAVFHRPPMSVDRPYLGSVLSTCPRVAATLVESDSCWWHPDAVGGGSGHPLDPAFGGRFLLTPLAHRARADGCRVLLYGRWADQLLLRAPYNQSALLWSLGAADFRREWPHFWRASRIGIARGLVMDLRRRLRGDSPLGALQVTRLVTGRYAGIMDQSDELARHVGVETRFPFLNRDLQEFVLGLPTSFLFREGENKRLLRRAYANRLPNTFLTRRSFAHIGPLVLDGMLAHAETIISLLTDSRLVDQGISAPSTIARALLPLQNRDRAKLDHRTIQQMVSAELWLRARLPSR